MARDSSHCPLTLPEEGQLIYPPPPPYEQPGYSPQWQAASSPVVDTQPVVTLPIFRDHPVTVIDSNGQAVTTVLQYKSGTLTWLMCCLVFSLTGGWWCVAIIVFCIDTTKDVYHITPTDKKIVGVYKRI